MKPPKKSESERLRRETREPLTGAQKRRLRGLAHSLQPLVVVGKGGLGEGVLQEVERALEHHELIKVRLGADRDQRRSWSRELAGFTGAHLVTEIGAMAVLFRQASDPDQRKIAI